MQLRSNVFCSPSSSSSSLSSSSSSSFGRGGREKIFGLARIIFSARLAAAGDKKTSEKNVRNTAENIRNTFKNERKTFENVRKTSENVQKTSENVRITSENVQSRRISTRTFIHILLSMIPMERPTSTAAEILLEVCDGRLSAISDI